MKLKEEQIFKSIFEATGTATMLVDENTNILMANKECFNTFGYLNEELIGQSWTRFAAPESLEEMLKNHKLRRKNPELSLKKYDVKLIHKNGENHDVILDITMIPGTKQSIVSMLDITELKRSQKIQDILYSISNAVLTTNNLKELIRIIRSELGTVIDTTNFFVALYDEKTDRFLLPYYHDEIDNVSSFPASKTITHYVIETQKPLLANLEDLKELERAGKIKLQGTDSHVWLGVPLIVDKKVIGAMVVQNYTNEMAYSHSDRELLEIISLHVSLAIQRKKVEEELLIAKERLHYLVANNPAVLFSSKAFGDFGTTFMSENVMLLLGYEACEFMQDSNFWTNRIHPDDVERIADYFPILFEKGHHIVEYRFRHKDGTYKWMRDEVRLVKDAQGKPFEIVGFWIDITGRKHADEKLKESEAKLRELNATKDKLFSIIAHDLRNPFNSILGFSELLIEDAGKSDVKESEKYLGIINSSAQNALILLDDLLDWARLQTGQGNFNPQKLILSSIIREIVEASSLAADIKNISLNYNLTDEIEVYADKNMIKTVLRNLISNAIKFTNLGGNIKVLVSSTPKQVEISISDNGLGIDKGECKKLFDISTNFTIPGTANEKGSGFGLVLCKEFVTEHGGKIWVESEKGKGSDFKFTLPLNKSN